MKVTKSTLLAGVAVIMTLSSIEAALAKPPTSVSNLVGTWVNVNANTGGIVKVVISNSSSGFKIHTYGACSPTPCDHGTVSASPFSKSVSSATAHGLIGQYDFGFSTKLVTAQRTFQFDGATFLEVETRTKFAPGDSRYDYMRTELFRKQ